MATKINLLPWREAHRKTKNTEFLVVLGICGALAGLVGFGGLKYAEDKVNFQNDRNERLEDEIALLQEELEEIKELDAALPEKNGRHPGTPPWRRRAIN